MTPFSLEGRTALVTGASRGIGASIARALDRAGATVAIAGRQREDLEQVRGDLSPKSIALEADLADGDAATALADRAQDALGPLDILVNNAGVGRRLPAEDLDAAVVDELYAVNVRAPLLLIARLVPTMKQRRSGAIINVSSVSGLVGTPRRAAYAATKGAIDAATRSLAVELGPWGVRVNSVAPGVVDTRMWARNKAVPGVVESVEAQTALRRWSQPDDVADVVVFLASDAARFVTGETIAADGGMARTLDLYAGDV